MDDDIDLNFVVIYRRNINHRMSFIFLVVFLRRTIISLGFLYVRSYNLNCMCPTLHTQTHVILQNFDEVHVRL